MIDPGRLLLAFTALEGAALTGVRCPTHRQPRRSAIVVCRLAGAAVAGRAMTPIAPYLAAAGALTAPRCRRRRWPQIADAALSVLGIAGAVFVVLMCLW